jgi:hypothetical protein
MASNLPVRPPAGGGIPPIDGKLPYGGGNSPVRQNCVVEPWHIGLAAVWTADGYLCPDGYDGCMRVVYEAPCTGYAYGRDGCAGWVPVLTRWEANCLFAPITTVPFVEAPADGNLYLRNGLSKTWVQNGAAPSVVSEAPLDGGYYVRHMGAWVQIETVPDVLTAPLTNGTY